MSDRMQSSRREVAEDGAIVGEGLGPQGGGGAAKPSSPGHLAGMATSFASDLAGSAVDHGRQLYETAKDQAAGYADDRKSGAAQSIADLATSLRDSGGTFEDRPGIQAFVGSAADGLDQLATGLRERSFAELYAEVETFARRQPVTVAAAAALAGFVLARFIKSSSEEMSQANASASVSSAQRPRRRTRPRASSDAV